MALLNTKTRYGAITKGFHWLTALLILTLIPLGIIADELPYATSEQLHRKAFLFSIHKTLGVTVFFVALARILWALLQPKPGLLNADNRAEAFLARTVHWLLYSSLLLVPITGWIHHAATEGFAPIWWPFGQNLPFVPTNDARVAHLFGSLHFAFERVLAFSVLLHILGALKHHFIDRDATLRRMLPGQPDVPDLPVQHPSRAPVFAALAAYGVALIAGAFLWYLPGLEETRRPAADTGVAEEDSGAAGNWREVGDGDKDGAITITVRQLGNEVSGAFQTWRSVIDFDDTVTEGVAGSVSMDIDISSLSLGALTAEALGDDFLSAKAHPVATFRADLVAGGGEYVAEGALTLNGVTRPLSIPFVLAMNGPDEARATARFVLDRLDYGIGQHMPDGEALGLEVEVRISLSARRAPG